MIDPAAKRAHLHNSITIVESFFGSDSIKEVFAISLRLNHY